MAARLIERRARTNSRPRSSRLAFTLIEVLVVVAIIALLISILLPSLAAARDRAKEAVCMARLSQAERGEATYETTQRGGIAGSPLTTGWFLTKYGHYDPSLPGFTRTAVDIFDWATPLRAQMYGVNSIPRPLTANANEIKDVRSRLYMKATDEPFVCPCNPLVISSFPATSNYPNIKGPSYLTMWTIMRCSEDVYNSISSQIRSGVAMANVCVPSTGYNGVALPSGYRPQIDLVGRPSMKVFLADGTRFYSGPPGTPDVAIDYNTDETGSKGMMSGEPPSRFALPGEPVTYVREYGMARKYSYRHGNHDSINAAFFDGHVQSLRYNYKGEGNHWTGEALHSKYYFPSKSTVYDPERQQIPVPKDSRLP